MGLEIATVDIVALILVYVYIGAVLGLSLYAEKHWPNIDNRKIVHIGIGNFVFIWWMFINQWVMLVFFTVPFAVILFIAMFKNNFISNSKLGELTRKGHVTGLFLYVVSINILVIFFFKDHWVAASIAIIAMTWGDGFGSIIGRRWGKHKIIHGKSLEGSLGVLGATFIIGMITYVVFMAIGQADLVLWGSPIILDTSLIIPWPLAILAASVLTAVLEAICNGDYDNFVNPLAVGALLWLLGM